MSKIIGTCDYQSLILDNITESVIVVDPTGTVDYMNHQARLIFDCQECSDINIWELLPKAYKMNQHQVESIIHSIRTTHTWQGEISLMMQEKPRVFMHRINPMVQAGEIKAYVIISTDIADLVEAREKAESANLAKSQFLANMSHEIRTPLIGVLGSVDLLEQSRLDYSQAENVQTIRECGEQLLSIINDILDVSKIEIGLIELNPQPTNLLGMITQILSIIDPMLKKKGLTLKLDLDPAIQDPVVLDAGKLRQVLINLLSNAVKFTQQGVITIRVRFEQLDDHNFLHLAISDTGIGIPPQQLQFIFDSFTQVDSSTSRGFGGTGLGLFISKRLLEVMDGEIWVESAPDHGTTFYLSIPLLPYIPESAPEPDEVGQVVPIPDDMSLQFIPPEILVVEDNDLNRKIVSQMLLNFGFQVREAINGLECLKILQDHHFDLILMDMQMPIMDGYEATRFIRDMESQKSIPIIAMTAHALTGDREKCLAAGCTSYIAKPFKTDELIQEICRHLNESTHQPVKSQSGMHQHLIEQLMPEFLEQLDELIMDLEQALQRQDTAQIASLSHDIKGTAGMYGYMTIAHTASLIEKAARNRSILQIKLLMDKIQQEFHLINTQVI